ncbi:hypothetical protein DYB37_010042 [Aphanomyces astaci]|uniref:FAD-binding FR-type domain-containing protein n=1 Tax=Aphanomyces astaci TaxID=112090 RepID=A0A3R7BIA5_APHAT|nr:hypothetical protein DYB35_009589 [Aphanomyces astaci]RHZ13031.1 hypothetical protein DYB37_010042 [Aphanomyces astaci]
MEGDSTRRKGGVLFDQYVALTPPPAKKVDSREPIHKPNNSAINTASGRLVQCLFVHNKREIWSLAVYVLLNATAFWWKCSLFPWDRVVGYGMCVAKGSAQVVVVNCCLALLLLSRSILHFVKAQPFLWRVFPLEHHMELHKLCGYAVFVSALTHSAAHVVNLAYTYTVTNQLDLDSSFYVRHVPQLHPHLPPLLEVAADLPMWTGFFLLVLLLVALPPSFFLSCRRRYHNAFWCTHMLLLPFLLVTCMHGATGWFQTPQAFLWIAPPLVLYILERRRRYFKRWTTPMTIHHVRLFPDAVALDLVKPPEFVFVPGMFVYLNVPMLGRHEWHPFSISSAPSDPHLSFRIQAAGDWTSALLKHLTTYALHDDDETWPQVHLDGPVGGPTVEYRRFRVVVLIGGGSGAAPFMSVLRDFFSTSPSPITRRPSVRCDTQKMYFHWVTRHESALEWFDETLRDLDAHGDSHLDTRLYVTQPNNSLEQAAHLHQFRNERPQWSHILDELEQKHPGVTVGIFYCGPQALQKELQHLCHSRSSNPCNSTKFQFYAESYY